MVYNSISNSEKILCQRSGDSGNTNNTFGSLFATVLGSDNSKQNTTVSDSSLIVSLLKLSASLVQTEIDKRSDVSETNLLSRIFELNKFLYFLQGGNRSELSTESQTDEIKAEQQNSIEIKTKVPCVADTGSILFCFDFLDYLKKESILNNSAPTLSNNEKATRVFITLQQFIILAVCFIVIVSNQHNGN